MIKDLVSGTDAGMFALCDVRFARGVTKTSLRALKPHVTTGDVFLFSPGGDCEIRARLLLDEPLPAGFQSKVCARQQNLLLKIPTGRLLWCGVEDLGKNAKAGLVDSTAPACTVDLPPGDYLIEASKLDWDEEPDAMAAQAEKQIIGSRVSPGRQRFTQCMGYLALIFLFGSPLALIISFAVGGWLACVKALGVIVLFYLIIVGISLLLAKHPSEKAYDEAFRRRNEILARFPDLVILMQRLPPETDPAKFNGGHLENQAD